MASTPMIEVTGLARRFGRGKGAVTALRDVHLRLDEAEVLGVLGVNGAGKTTLIKILATLLYPSEGRARVAGFDVVDEVREVRRRLAVVFGGDRGLYPRLSAIDNVRFLGVLKGLPRREVEARAWESLERLGLGQAARRPVETFSKGMRQRLHLAIGLLTTPQVLLLDEPTVGLDPLEAQRLRESVAALPAKGVTVLLTSHYLTDIEQLATRVALLQDGRITHDSSLREFLALAQAVAVVKVSGRGEPPRPGGTGHEHLLGAGDVVRNPGGWEVHYVVREWGSDTLAALARCWPPGAVDQVSVEPVTLESVFADVTRQGDGAPRA